MTWKRPWKEPQATANARRNYEQACLEYRRNPNEKNKQAMRDRSADLLLNEQQDALAERHHRLMNAYWG